MAVAAGELVYSLPDSAGLNFKHSQLFLGKCLPLPGAHEAQPPHKGIGGRQDQVILNGGPDHERLGVSVFGHVSDACVDGLAQAVDALSRFGKDDLPLVRLGQPEQNLAQLMDTGVAKAAQPQHLAAAQLKGDIAQDAVESDAIHLQHGLCFVQLGRCVEVGFLHFPSHHETFQFVLRGPFRI